MAEQGDELIAQFDLADEEEQQRGEEQDKLSGGGREERNHGDHYRGGRHVHIEPSLVAEQRAFQLVQSRHWLVEHREFVFDSGDDFRPPRNPLADRARASAIAARLTAPRPSSRMTIAVSQVGIPRRLAAFMTGASVSASTAAAKMGSNMARPT